MRLLDETTVDGVCERTFLLGDVPGVLWTPAGHDPDVLILLAHGGGQHKRAPGIVARARRFASGCGFAAMALDAPGHGDRPRAGGPSSGGHGDRVRTGDRPRPGGDERHAATREPIAPLAERAVPEWRAALDTWRPRGPVGFWGVSMGSVTGIPLAAAEPRIRAAVFGLTGTGDGRAEAAARITVPVEFLLQWHDELLPRADGLALFDAFAAAEKTLHANAGGHVDVPRFEVDSAERFFRRHLG
jgi:dienelactone hydrolase